MKSELKEVALGIYLAGLLLVVILALNRCQNARRREREAVQEAQLLELRQIKEKLKP